MTNWNMAYFYVLLLTLVAICYINLRQVHEINIKLDAIIAFENLNETILSDGLGEEE